MYEVIIIGAGYAGLNAAHELRKSGIEDVLVLEARDRVGGRIKAGSIAGITIDLGGMWLGPNQKRLAQLARDYEVETYPTYLDGKTVYRFHGKTLKGERENYDRLFSIGDMARYFLANRQMKRWMDQLDTQAPWEHPEAEILDAMTLADWMNRKLVSERLKTMYQIICFSVFCAEPSQVSLLFFLHYVKCGNDLDELTSADSGGAQNFLFTGGVHQIAQRMADDLGDRLKLNQAVESISKTDYGYDVSCGLKPYQARKVIVAVPATLVPHIEFSPPLPKAKQALHDRLIMGSAIKYWVAYESPFWREAGLNGSIIQDDSPASPCYDVSPPNQTKGIIAGFFDGDHAIHYSDKSTERRKSAVLSMLAEHFGEKALKPLEYVDTDWTTEQWSSGCYGAFAPPGVYSHYGQWLKKPIEGLFWAGTETGAEWTGYIEGALESGERAAKQVARAL